MADAEDQNWQGQSNGSNEPPPEPVIEVKADAAITMDVIRGSGIPLDDSDEHRG